MRRWNSIKALPLPLSKRASGKETSSTRRSPFFSSEGLDARPRSAPAKTSAANTLPPSGRLPSPGLDGRDLGPQRMRRASSVTVLKPGNVGFKNTAGQSSWLTAGFWSRGWGSGIHLPSRELGALRRDEQKRLGP